MCFHGLVPIISPTEQFYFDFFDFSAFYKYKYSTLFRFTVDIERPY